MEIPPLNSRTPLPDIAEQAITRTSAIVREVFGNRELVQAIVQQPPQPERFSAADGPRPNQQAQLQRVLLQVEGRNLEALSPRPLREGQVLTLQLDPQGRVQVQAIDGRPLRTEPELLQRIIEQLRPQLARQDSPLALIRNLFTLFSRQLGPQPNAAVQTAPQSTASAAQPAPPAGGPAPAAAPRTTAGDTLPPTVIEPLLRTLASLSSTENLQTNLQAAIRNSGQFLEAKLAGALPGQTAPSRPDAARGAPAASGNTSAGTAGQQLERALAGDLKANLLRLQDALQQAIPASSETRSGALPDTKPAATQVDQVLRQLSQAAVRLAGQGSLVSRPAATGSRPTGIPPSATEAARAASPLAQLLAFPAPVPSHGATIAVASDSMDLALSTLLRQVAATLARMNMQQLQTVTQQQASGQEAGLINSWLAEIPLVHGQQVHLYQLRIDEEDGDQDDGGENKDQEQERTWSFTLSFDIAPMGPMYAQVRLRREQVSAKFWAEQPETLRYVREELDHLKQQLGGLGLQVSELEAYPGAPAQRQTRILQQLVDIQT